MTEHKHTWKIDYSQPTFDVVGVDRHTICKCGATGIWEGLTGQVRDIDDGDPCTDAENNTVLRNAIDKAIENDSTLFTTRSFTVLWNEGHSVRLINRHRLNREAISIPWDEIDALAAILRPVNTELKATLDELTELERVANATRRGSDLAAYKIALDDVRAGG